MESHELKLKLLNILDNLNNNNMKLERELISFSSKEEQVEYINLLVKQKELFNEIKTLDLKEEKLEQKEKEITFKETQLNKKEEKIKEKEIKLKEKEEKKLLQEKEEEKKAKKIKRKKEIKNIIENTLNQQKNVEPKKLFSDISKLGKVLKDEMQEELKENPDKFVNINQELNSNNSKFFPSAVLAKNLQKEGILTLVEKDAKSSPLHDVSLRFILNGVINQKKILIKYDFGPSENHKIICDMEYQKDFIEKEYDKISNLLNIPREYFSICNFSDEAVQYELIINENFAKNNDNLDPFISTDSNFEDEFQNKCQIISFIRSNEIKHRFIRFKRK